MSSTANFIKDTMKSDVPAPAASEPSQQQAFRDVDQNVTGRDVGNSLAVNSVYGMGFHPQAKKMTLTRMAIAGNNPKFVKDQSAEMVCHYNPETVQENIGANYLTAQGVAGVRVERYQFKEARAKTWNMTILLSSWGDDMNRRHPACMNVKDSLNWIRECIRPPKATGYYERYSDGSVAQMDAPPPIFVNIFDEAFVAYMTDAVITYQKLSPLSGEPIRAEVNLSFVEYVNVKL